MLSGFRWKRNDNKCYCLSFKYQKPKNLFCFSYKYFQRFLLLNSFFVLNRKTDFFSFLWRNKNVFLLVILKLINYVQSTWDKQYFLFFNPCPSLQPSQLYRRVNTLFSDIFRVCLNKGIEFLIFYPYIFATWCCRPVIFQLD